MLDKTITSALLTLRKQIVREKQDGLEHVNALLVARGIDPTRLHVPCKQLDREFGHRGVQLLALASLRTGAKTHAQIAVDFMAAKPGLDHYRAMIRVYRTIYKLRDRGMVRRDGRLWGLAQ